MNQLLKTEWLKIKNYNAFKVLSIFFLAGIFLSNYIVFRFVNAVTSDKTASMIVGQYSPYNFEYTWQTTSYVTGWLLILPAMIMIILVTNEFTYRTNRQNIIDGWSRQQFIDVKIVMAAIFAIVSTVVVIITAALFGFMVGGDFVVNQFQNILYFLLKAFTYNMAAVLFSVLIRRTGFAIGVFFIYLGAENLISNLLNFWSMYLNKNNGIDLGSLGDYLPMNASDGLLSFPDNPLKSVASGIMPSDYKMVVTGFAVAYLLLFIWWSRKKIIHSDL